MVSAVVLATVAFMLGTVGFAAALTWYSIEKDAHSPQGLRSGDRQARE